MKTSRNIAVIGAGVVGLSTAVCIQENVPLASVTIFADKFGSDTLSDGAGGLFRPAFSIDPDKERVLKWCKRSLHHFLDIFSSVHSAAAGVQMVSGYHLSSTSTATCNNPLLKKLLHDYQALSEKELELFPSEYKNGTFYTTLVVDCRYYLPWLKKKFEAAGGEIKTKRINKLSEIPDKFDVIVNCTGLGAKDLLNDHQLIPIRGQTIKVKAPWLKHFYYADEVYIIPGVDYVTLGGVKDYGSWNMEVNLYQKQFIRNKCVELIPSLQQVEFKYDWVGLRPYRPSVRVDSVIVQCDSRFLKVVNNYGHGGNGVTLSWGTAREATELVKKLLKDSFLISNL